MQVLGSAQRTLEVPQVLLWQQSLSTHVPGVVVEHNRLHGAEAVVSQSIHDLGRVLAAFIGQQVTVRLYRLILVANDESLSGWSNLEERNIFCLEN